VDELAVVVEAASPSKKIEPMTWSTCVERVHERRPISWPFSTTWQS
jgi:hypothetical protein